MKPLGETIDDVTS